MRLLPALALLLVSASCLAGETPWQEVAPTVSMRLISTGDVRPDGSTLIGLEIDMPANTKTYWRVPGETGIPTEVDLAGSTGILAHEILWPYPTIDQSQGYMDYVYFGPTVLPVEVRLENGEARLALAATLGICSEICMPVRARFEMTLGAEEPDRVNGLRIRQAMAEAPIEWHHAGSPPGRQADAPIGGVWFDRVGDALTVDLTGSEIDPRSLLGAFVGDGPVLGAPEPHPSGKTVRLPIIGRYAPEIVEGRAVDLVFQTGMGAFSLSRTVGSPGR